MKTVKKHSATFLPGNTTMEYSENTLLIDILQDAGFHINSPCGGRGTCGRCAVQATGPLSEPSQSEHPVIAHRRNTRLSCQARGKGDIVIQTSSIIEKPYPGIPGIIPGRKYGIAVDIGTTMIKIAIADLETGNMFEVDSFLNPQRRYGHDVINRISASADPAIMAKLVSLVRSSINYAIRRLRSFYGLNVSDIEQLVFSGNTVMLHLMFGIDPASLGVFPYTLLRRDFDNITASDIDFYRHDNEAAPAPSVLGLPAVSAYLGGDFIGGVACIEDAGFNSNYLFIDLGTNGEIAVCGSPGETYATSCAMGPALEGMNISCGMTADIGAIDHCTLTKGVFSYHVIGDGEPVGLCGTGLIDALALFLANGIIGSNGTFDKSYFNEGHAETNPLGLSTNTVLGEKFMIIAGNTAIGQKDIRSIQLARGASRAGAEILLKESGISKDAIRHVIIAGAFGEKLNIDNFRSLGFIPDFPQAEYVFLGNTSIKAAARVCYDKVFYEFVKKRRDGIRTIELSVYPGFNEIFMRGIEFTG